MTLEREVRQLKTKEEEIRMKLKLYHDGIVVTNGGDDGSESTICY